MNIGKSIRVAIVQNDKDTKWLAKRLKVSVSRINNLKKSIHGNTETVDRLANIFKMSGSEFIALGE